MRQNGWFVSNASYHSSNLILGMHMVTVFIIDMEKCVCDVHMCMCVA